MARYRGQDAVLKNGATAITGEVDSWSIETAAEVIQEPALSDAWVPAVAGRKSWRGQVTVFYDSETAASAALLVEGATISGAFYPSGEVAARQELTGDFVIESVSLEVPNNAFVKAKVAFVGAGALTRAVVAP